MPEEDLLQMGFVQIAKWVSSRSKFDTFRSDDRIFSREASLFCGHSKVRKMVS